MNLELAKKYLSYDPETGRFVWIKDRLRVKSGDSAGCIHTGRGGRKYVIIKINGIGYKAHRLAWLFSYGEFPDFQIDHENQDGCDNRLCNLRSVTCMENQRNAKLRVDNKSGVCGVSFNKEAKKWQACIRINKVKKYLGRYIDFESAVGARKEAEKLYGFHHNHGLARSLS